jgi:hypothetical protein
MILYHQHTRSLVYFNDAPSEQHALHARLLMQSKTHQTCSHTLHASLPPISQQRPDRLPPCGRDARYVVLTSSQPIVSTVISLPSPTTAYSSHEVGPKCTPPAPPHHSRPADYPTQVRRRCGGRGSAHRILYKHTLVTMPGYAKHSSHAQSYVLCCAVRIHTYSTCKDRILLLCLEMRSAGRVASLCCVYDERVLLVPWGCRLLIDRRRVGPFSVPREPRRAERGMGAWCGPATNQWDWWSSEPMAAPWVWFDKDEAV